MTPAEQYAAKHREAVAIIEAQAPLRLHAPLIESLRPAIALKATRIDDADIAIGASKFGGAPDVPEGFEWPMWEDKPLDFVAQINLNKIAEFDIENLLPPNGVLSFFYDFDEDGEWPFGDPEDEGGWRVFHFTEVCLRRSQRKTNESDLRSAKIEASALWGLSQVSADSSSLNTQMSGDLVHQMLGEPRQVQGDPREEAVYIGQRNESEDWLLLFQVDCDDEINFMWGDAGAMYYLISRDKLKEGDFSKVWLIAQCA